MDHEPPIPPRLTRDLRAAYQHAADADRRTQEGGRAVLASVRRRRMMLRWTPLAAAAAIGLAFVLVPRRGTSPFPSTASPAPNIAFAPGADAAGRGDHNGDGRLDILDALVVATDLARNATRPGQDFDGDGVVTAADVDAIGAAVVKVDSRVSTLPERTGREGRWLGFAGVGSAARGHSSPGAPL